MQTQTAQLRVTLPIQLQNYLQNKSEKFGLSMSSYVRNLIVNDVRSEIYPVYEMSEQSQGELVKAEKARKNKKVIFTNDVSQFLADL
ncbi:MAG TPA: hypothetical protein PKX78_04525 [Candidatus Woesebacteria bacterium]|jgi:hypothetical protein|nr:hypothetical protein [Candidatus Woesebacteria bacterium]